MADSNPHGDSMLYDIVGTHYPYLNVKQNLITSIMKTFKNFILPFNPIAMP